MKTIRMQYMSYISQWLLFKNMKIIIEIGINPNLQKKKNGTKVREYGLN